jgi:hypothetical protein
MEVNFIEILNVVLSLLLLMLAIHRNSSWLIIAMLSYGSMYFLYSAIPLIIGASVTELSLMRVHGSGILVKLSTIIFLLVMFVALAIRAGRFFNIDTRALLHFVVVMTIMLAGYLNDIRPGDRLQLQNMVGAEGMLALMCLGYIGLRGEGNHWNIRRAHLYVINCALLLAAGIAIYEVFSHRAWAATLQSSGSIVWRASSILFNPNLYAFWSSLIYIGFAYGMHEYANYRKLMLFGMSLTSIGMYFSGARSTSFLLLGVLLLCAIGIGRQSRKLRWVPLIIIPVTFLLIYFSARGILAFSVGDGSGWQSIALLGERFAATPINIFRYLIQSSQLAWLVAPELAGVVAPEISVSIEGRFIGENRDSGLLSLHNDAGLIGVAAMLWLWGTLFVWSVTRYRRNPDAASVYSFGILLYCFLVGLTLRFQVFPVWLFIGGCLAPCIVLWRSDHQ